MLKSTGVGGRVSRLLYGIFGWVPFSPNQITLIAMLVSLIGMVIARVEIGLAFMLFGFAFLLDAVDGAIARGRGETSSLGAFLDGISDRLVEFLMLAAIFTLEPTAFIIFPHQVWVVITLFFGSVMTAYVRSYATHQGVLPRAEAEKMPGILERAERCLLLLLFLGVYAMGEVELAGYVLVATGILSFVTFVERFTYVLVYANKT